MKLTAILLFAACLQVSATGYSQKITLSQSNVSLRKVFKEIENQSGYQFFYKDRLVRQAENVSINVTNASIEEALDQCFKNQQLTFSILDKIIVVKAKPNVPVAIKTLAIIPTFLLNIITGTVKDEKGNPLAGVSVILKGTNEGTNTDAVGRFTIDANVGEVLEFTIVGYQKRSVKVEQSSNLSIVMEIEATVGNQIVVVGYGTQKKISLTSAVDQIKGEDVNRRPVSSLAQSLQGIAPGITVSDVGGSPGQSDVFINIRGISTLSSSSPLVLVDGIEQRLTDINPSDIESISVLKDASSTAIYGSRASNGVILITTKRGKSGKVNVTFNSYYAIQKSMNHPLAMDPHSYFELENVAYENAGSGQKYSDQYINDYVDSIKTDPLKYPAPMPNWFKAVLRSAPQSNGDLSVSGGNEHIQTFLSLRDQDQDGVIPNFKSRIREIRLNNNFKISKKINVRADINYRYSLTTSPLSSLTSSIYSWLLAGSLFAVPQYPDGSYGIGPQGKNPLLTSEIAGLSQYQDNLFVGNLNADWEILKGLKFITLIGANVNLNSEKDFANSYIVTNYFNPSQVLQVVSPNSLSESSYSDIEYTINNLLTYNNSFGSHDIKVLLGYSQIGETTNSFGASRQNFYNNQIQALNAGANDDTKSNSGSDAAYGLRSYFGRLNYSFKDKYLLEVNGRYDGSSNFSTLKQYAFFPSFSAGWRLSQEDFWNKLKNVINEFKLRGSWGKTGNQAIPAYQFYPSMSLLNYTFSGNPAQGYIQNTYQNEDLTWETTTQVDAGLDAEFLDNKLGTTIDYYKKRTTGILLQLPIPETIGENSSYTNAGIVEDWGWEFQTNYKNKIGNLEYLISGNFNISHNKIVSLAGTGPFISGSSTGDDNMTIRKEGLPVDALWGYKTDGYFQSQEEISKYPTIASNTEPGDTKYLDLNGDGKITPDDMTYLGNTFPVYTFGTSIDLEYKGFGLYLLLQGDAGAKDRVSGPLAEMGSYEGFVDKIFTNNYWTPDNPKAQFPRPIKLDLRNLYPSDLMIYDASYLRLQNVQFQYTLPFSASNKFRIRKANLYISLTNLFTISKFYKTWHLDPEQPEMPLVESGSGFLNSRTNYYPQTRLVAFGLKLQF